MSSNKSLEFKVGLFAAIATIMIMFSMVVVDPDYFKEKKTHTYYTLLPDAAGIKPETQVTTSGIIIGSVSKVQLTDKLVKIFMEVDEHTILPIDTVINVRTRGILGDVFIDIARGKEASKQIKPGGLIPRNAVSNDFNSLLNTLSGISRDIKQITSTLRVVLGSEETGDSLREIITNLRELTIKISHGFEANEKPITQMIDNFTKITDSARNILGNNEENITAFLADMKATGQLLREMAVTLKKVANPENASAISAFVDKIHNAAEEVDIMMKNLNHGRGSVGKLLYEDKTVNLINETLENVQNFVKPMNDVVVLVNYKGEAVSGGRKLHHFGMELQTSPDKSYYLGLVDDSNLKSHTIRTVTTTDDAKKTANTVTSETISDTGDRLLFDFQFRKKWWNTGLRFGLFSSSGGLAVDQFLLDDNLQLTLEAYNFSRVDSGPVARLFGEYHFWEHLYVTGGLHDFTAGLYSGADDEFYKNFFGGMGIRFTDENIKTLLSIGSLAK